MFLFHSNSAFPTKLLFDLIEEHQLFEVALLALANSKDASGFGQVSTWNRTKTNNKYFDQEVQNPILVPRKSDELTSNESSFLVFYVNRKGFKRFRSQLVQILTEMKIPYSDFLDVPFVIKIRLYFMILTRLAD